MKNIPAPSHSGPRTRADGEIVHVTEWVIGAYTLRKSEEPGYTGWNVRAAGYDLPDIDDAAPYGQRPEFGVNWSAHGVQRAADARDYAEQIMRAADAAATFTEIVAND